jgi:hypothetical protein
MRRGADNSAWWALAVLALAAGAALVAAAAWMRPLAEGERAVGEGRLDLALDRFAAAEARFDRVPLSKQALASSYERSQSNQVWLLYRLGRYDAVVEKAAASVPSAPIHFWAGCALFAKARNEKEGEARLGWLTRAGDEFRLALERDPGDWDTKFNYELTRRLEAELRQPRKAPPPQLLQLLRPKPKEGRAPGRRTG